MSLWVMDSVKLSSRLDVIQQEMSLLYVAAIYTKLQSAGCLGVSWTPKLL